MLSAPLFLVVNAKSQAIQWWWSFLRKSLEFAGTSLAFLLSLCLFAFSKVHVGLSLGNGQALVLIYFLILCANSFLTFITAVLHTHMYIQLVCWILCFFRYSMYFLEAILSEFHTNLKDFFIYFNPKPIASGIRYFAFATIWPISYRFYCAST